MFWGYHPFQRHVESVSLCTNLSEDCPADGLPHVLLSILSFRTLGFPTDATWTALSEAEFATPVSSHTHAFAEASCEFIRLCYSTFFRRVHGQLQSYGHSTDDASRINNPFNLRWVTILALRCSQNLDCCHNSEYLRTTPYVFPYTNIFVINPMHEKTGVLCLVSWIFQSNAYFLLGTNLAERLQHSSSGILHHGHR